MTRYGMFFTSFALLSIAGTYHFTGEVMEVDEGAVSLKGGEQIPRFEKIRDDIPCHESKQLPGEAAPENTPREKKQIILDDRAFYDASRDAKEFERSKTMT